MSNLRGGCLGWCNRCLIIGKECIVYIAACPCMMLNAIVLVSITTVQAQAIGRTKSVSGNITVYKQRFEVRKWRECSCDGVIGLVNGILRTSDQLLSVNNGRIHSAREGGSDLLHLRTILFVLSYHSYHISIICIVTMLVSGYFILSIIKWTMIDELLSCIYFQLSPSKCASPWKHTNCSNIAVAWCWYLWFYKSGLQ